MAETLWTQEQQAAIYEKDCNLLVAAAAGAGKTAVLVERIIRKIIDDKAPIDIDSLLVVTFTNAAATEMRERIGAALAKTIEENKASKDLQRQLALLNKAAITTIHSFCLEVIRNNFQSIEIDPKFRILDETEAALMKLETLNELFEEIYEAENENQDFFDLLETYGSNRDDQKLQEMVLNIYGFVQSYPWPEQWLTTQAESFNPIFLDDFVKSDWGIVITETVQLRLEGLKTALEAVIHRLKYAAGFEKYVPVYYEDMDRLEVLLKLVIAARKSDNQQLGEHTPKECSDVSWDDIYNNLLNYDFGRLPTCGKDADKQLQEQVKAVRDEIKAYIKSLKEDVFFQKSEDIILDLKQMYPALKCISKLVVEFEKRYSTKKQLKATVDFNDLEHFCLKILTESDESGNIKPSAVAMEYKEKFTEILVDEYQDSNLVQEIIISMISREDKGKPNVFMVGDVKQSIYRFRQAKPELFMKKYNVYSVGNEGLYRKILLFKNFRSRKEVVDGVNYVFEQIMSDQIGELDYDETERLNPGAVFPENEDTGFISGGDVELLLMETSSTQNSDNFKDDSEEEPEEQEEEEILDNLQKEARMVAGRIIELLRPDKSGKRFSVFDKKNNCYKEVQFRDIVILLRTTKNWTEVFCEELARCGIPAFADTGSGFFKTPEVQVMLSLLQIIDNPYQDIPLLSVLRSPIGNFTTDDLAELRLTDRKASLYDALGLLADNETPAAVKARNFNEALKQWKAMSLYMSTHSLIWRLYNETGYFSIIGAMPDGERKQANLRVLFERALQFEKTSYKGLFNFINFIDKLKTGKGDLGSAKVLGENDNVVRLMSIHKSKGLEFPVVFVSGCGKKFNFQDMYKSVLLHQELGFGPDFVDHRKRIKYPSVPKLAISQKVRLETLSEEMRILYVALTRAREKLILTGSVANIQKSALKWLTSAANQNIKFPAYETSKAQSFLDWICPAVMRHDNALAFRFAAGTGVDIELPKVDKEAVWSVYLHTADNLSSVKKLDTAQEDQFDVIDWLKGQNFSEPNIINEIDRRLSWEYRHLRMTGIPSKFSVTEIKRYFNLNNEGEGEAPVATTIGIRKPAFLQERKGLSAAEKGTVMHFVMQHLDYTDKNIDGQLDVMVNKELITKQQADCVDVNKIQRFINSDICNRINSAEKVYREVPFNLELPLLELYSDFIGEINSDETILLQGVIDCYFEEDGKIVLIDYKTDYIEQGSADKVKERYQTQLSYYSRALEKLTGLKVNERYIYLFSTGELVEV